MDEASIEGNTLTGVYRITSKNIQNRKLISRSDHEKKRSDFKLEEIGWRRHENILYKELTSGSDEKVKWERNAHSEGKNLTFFSMEYLTDSQIEALGVKHGVNK